MRAVAEGRVRGVLALAEPCVAGFLRGEFLRRKRRAFVRAIAEGLRRGFSAGAEPVILSRFEGDFRRGFRCYDRLFAHASGDTGGEWWMQASETWV